MINLPKLIILSVWLTLVIWLVVEKLYEEKYTTVAPTIVIKPEQLGE